MQRTSIPFGVIGCGSMGREFAAAAARWCQLLGDLPRPEVVAGCVTPEETKSHHDIPTAALESRESGRVVQIADLS